MAGNALGIEDRLYIPAKRNFCSLRGYGEKPCPYNEQRVIQHAMLPSVSKSLVYRYRDRPSTAATVINMNHLFAAPWLQAIEHVLVLESLRALHTTPAYELPGKLRQLLYQQHWQLLRFELQGEQGDGKTVTVSGAA